MTQTKEETLRIMQETGVVIRTKSSEKRLKVAEAIRKGGVKKH